jgi:nitrate/TMAO reductase-like tetraheme cytochrome c subunit
VPQLEAKELYVISMDFLTNKHNSNGCRSCHMGTPGVDFKANAHKGYMVDPSAKADIYCASCHKKIVEYHNASVHANQSGYETMLLDRSGAGALTSDMNKMLGDRCYECHTTCGQCHISQPDVVNGGLIDGHTFKKTPNQTRNCTACHGSRIGDEFKGSNAGLKASIHYSSGMNCFNCHTGTEIHGTNSAADIRYNVTALPECLDCHSNVKNDSIEMHEMHVGQLACQICHSQPYKNCYSCHVSQLGSSIEHGLMFPSQIDFKIGRNPIKSEKHPEDFVLLRHIPIAPNSFEEYGIELPNFTTLPTWKYASPHNILRRTPQNESCESCHGMSNLFLTEDYINEKISEGLMAPVELQANKDVIINNVP